jgi:integrase/recombinase XerD
VFESQPRHLFSTLVFWTGEDGSEMKNVPSRFRTIVARVERDCRAERIPFTPFRFHDLRHWFAVEYLKRGGSIYHLQKILGHASIKTTELYLDHLTPDEAARAKGATTAM